MTGTDPMNNGSDIVVAVEGTSTSREAAAEMIEPRKRAVETCKWTFPRIYLFTYLKVVVRFLHPAVRWWVHVLTERCVGEVCYLGVLSIWSVINESGPYLLLQQIEFNINTDNRRGFKRDSTFHKLSFYIQVSGILNHYDCHNSEIP